MERSIKIALILLAVGAAGVIGVYYISATRTVRIMTREETAEFLDKDADGYIASLSEVDLHARGAENHDAYKRTAVNAACDFAGPHGKKILVAANMAGVSSHILIAGTSGRAYEEGLPHTRENVIFITPEIAAGSMEHLVETLRHENVHIYQREHPQEMERLLKAQGYTRVNTRGSYPLARANPDLDSWIYSDKNGKVLIAEYNSTTPSSIRDVKLSDPAYEHPYEKMAYTK